MPVPLDSSVYLFPPMPTVLVGANVAGKPNYITIAWVGIMNSTTLSFSLLSNHYTNAGIKENGTFSVNIPSFAMIAETDYCGLVSGRDVDKGALFESFYGQLGTAPMIRGCPICIECRLAHTLDLFRRTEVFVGEIVQIYGDEEYLVEGRPDWAKIQPIFFSGADGSYWRLGEHFGKIGSAGKVLMARHQE